MKSISKLRILLVGTALFVVIFMLFDTYSRTNHEEKAVENLRIVGFLEEKEIELSLFKEYTDQRYYLVLPSAFAQTLDRGLTFRVENASGIYRIEIDGKEYKNGDIWSEEGKEAEHQLVISAPFGEKYVYPLQILVSENLPAVMITVEDEFEILNPQNVSAQQYIEKGYIELWNADGELALNQKMEVFKVRGNHTATLAKRPFTFTLEVPASICGMEEALTWNLLANATDGSYLRNKIVLDMAKDATDDYVPQAEYVDVFLNGQYYGMYLLTETVEIGEMRLDIDPEQSWFAELELDFRDWLVDYSFVSKSGNTFAVHSEYIYKTSEKEQLENLIDRAEDIILNAEDSDAEIGSVIDVDSWVFAWCIQEISGNCDVGLTSQFLYTKEKSDTALLYAGPVWDFDATMGNTYVAMFRVPNALTAAVEEIREPESANRNRWMAGMYQHEDFQDAVMEKYEEVFAPLIEEVLQQRIENYVNTIERSATLDALRWNRERLGWPFVLPEGIEVPEEGDYRRFDTLDENVQMVRDFLAEKKAFLDKLWIEGVEFEIIVEENTEPVLDSADVIYKWIEQGGD